VNARALLAALAVGGGAAGVAAVLYPPVRRLAPRVRPYAVVARSALGHAPEPVAGASRSLVTSASLPGVFGPLVLAAVARVSRLLEARTDEHLARALRQAGLRAVTPDDYRVRQVVVAAGGALAGGALAALTVRVPVVALLGAAGGFMYGAARARQRLDQAITARSARVRLELYTVNHLLAMHVRTGSGAMQAVQRVVERGNGAVVEELAEVLAWTRRGASEADAFRRAAELTAEPSAARTYQLLAAGVERGVDLSSGLLALSEDIRDARREQLHKEAVRRRAAMLVPTIGVLAPIMLLFIAAPLPSIVLGHK
jgi:Flp pilus assembly protein TadB